MNHIRPWGVGGYMCHWKNWKKKNKTPLAAFKLRPPGRKGMTIIIELDLNNYFRNELSTALVFLNFLMDFPYQLVHALCIFCIKLFSIFLIIYECSFSLFSFCFSRIEKLWDFFLKFLGEMTQFLREYVYNLLILTCFWIFFPFYPAVT